MLCIYEFNESTLSSDVVEAAEAMFKKQDDRRKVKKDKVKKPKKIKTRVGRPSQMIKVEDDPMGQEEWADLHASLWTGVKTMMEEQSQFIQGKLNSAHLAVPTAESIRIFSDTLLDLSVSNPEYDAPVELDPSLDCILADYFSSSSSSGTPLDDTFNIPQSRYSDPSRDTTIHARRVGTSLSIDLPNQLSPSPAQSQQLAADSTLGTASHPDAAYHRLEAPPASSNYYDTGLNLINSNFDDPSAAFLTSLVASPLSPLQYHHQNQSTVPSPSAPYRLYLNTPILSPVSSMRTFME